MQPMIKVPLELSIDSDLDIDHLDLWLTQVLQINLEKYKNKSKDYQHIVDVVWRILLLRKTLLQAVNVPLFFVGDIIDVQSISSNHYIVSIKVARVENIPAELYLSSMQLSINMVSKHFNKAINKESMNQLFDFVEINFLQKYKYTSGSGKSTLPILSEAHRKKIPFLHFGNGIYQLGWGINSKIFSRSSIIDDSAIGSSLSENKVVTSNLVRTFGLPAPIHEVVTTYEQAIESAKQLGWPLVTKPIDLNRGEGVTVGIDNVEALKKGFELAYNRSNIKRVIIEKQVNGVCCRIFIADNKMFYAVNRLPKSIFADGKRTIRELINDANEQNLAYPPWNRTEEFPMDQETLDVIKRLGYTLDTVVKNNTRISLREIESTQWGGYDEDVTNTIHPENIEIAKKAAQLFNLKVSGVDIISEDITKPWYENGAIINEVNYSPAYGTGDISKATIPAYLESLIEGNGRIPIKIFIGGEKALKKAKKYQAKRLQKKKSSFLTSHKITISNNLDEVIYPFESLSKRIKSLLMNINVEELLIVIQTNEFLIYELPIDSIDEIIEVSSEIQNYNDQDTVINQEQYEQLKNLLYSVN